MANKQSLLLIKLMNNLHMDSSRENGVRGTVLETGKNHKFIIIKLINSWNNVGKSEGRQLHLASG